MKVVHTQKTRQQDQPSQVGAAKDGAKEHFDQSRIGLTALEEYAQKTGYDHYDHSPSYQAWLHWGGF